jgi:gamma-glutamyl-gamma-aminobutyrate hydrolase PuuD|tara:strand:+ start:3190 stop:3831 length:642 start_codon:yes stop_codon:yes gene_type:complete
VPELKFPSLITAHGEESDVFARVLHDVHPQVRILEPDADLQPDIGGLLVFGESVFGAMSESPPPALLAALKADIPVLGVGWGMHALNVALGGKPPVRLVDSIVVGQRPGRRGRIVELGKMRTFLTLGGKVAATIGAGGPVATPGPGEFAIREAEKASGLMASAYDIETGAIEAIEMPGYHWIIGVAWPLHRLDLLPARFDNIVASFVERSTDA